MKKALKINDCILEKVLPVEGANRNEEKMEYNFYSLSEIKKKSLIIIFRVSKYAHK